MSRDNIVSVRLTDEELAALRKMGRPSEVLRQLLRDEIRAARKLLAAPLAMTGSSTGTSGGGGLVLWNDGTVSPIYPQPNTAP